MKPKILTDKENEVKEIELKIEEFEKLLDLKIKELEKIEKSLIIHVESESKSSGGHDPHYFIERSLKVGGDEIKATGWDIVSLNLSEKHIRYIAENHYNYNMRELNRYCNRDSFKALELYMEYKKIKL